MLFGTMRLAYSTLACPRWTVEEAVAAAVRYGYDGYLSLEWEKQWHPEIAEPEIALLHYKQSLCSVVFGTRTERVFPAFYFALHDSLRDTRPCHLLGFQLLPRLKNLHAQRLYRPETGQPDAYPNLQPILTRPIR